MFYRPEKGPAEEYRETEHSDYGVQFGLPHCREVLVLHKQHSKISLQEFLLVCPELEPDPIVVSLGFQLLKAFHLSMSDNDICSAIWSLHKRVKKASGLK